MKEKPTRNRKDPLRPDRRGKITELFDIPGGALGGTSQMEIAGNREVVIDGCLGVLAYDEDLIRLALRGMVATFRGRGLQIKVLTHDSAIIAGYLSGIDFSVQG